MKTKSLLVLALTVAFLQLPAAHGQDAAKKPEVLNNASVIQLKSLGLGDDLIIQKIKSTKCDFDTGLDGLKQLKAASVSDNVISAMMGAATAATTSTPAAAADPNDPKAPHDSGIWLYEETNGTPHMTQMEPSVYSQSQSGSFFAAQFGATTKSKAVLRSAHANLETISHRPVFYFYFDKKEGGLSDNSAVPTNPNEYILAQFEVSEKDNQRAVAMGQFNAYSGTKSGTDAEALRSFRSQKLAPGVYKVWVENDLNNGEYGFYFAAAGGASPMAMAHQTDGKVFDFRINGTPDAAPPPQATQTTTNSDDGKKHPFKNLFHKVKADQSTPPQTDQPSSPKASN